MNLSRATQLSLRRFALVWMLGIALCSVVGCIKTDRNKSVTVVIAGIETNLQQKEVVEILETMYDKDRRYKRYKSRFQDSQLTVEMEPVTDVEAFSRRINFGTVTEVTGRTIKVTYTKSRATLII